MSNRWLIENKLDTVGVTFTPESEQAAYPATHLNTGNYSETWRSEDAPSIYFIEIDFGQAVTVNTLFLGNVNFTGGAFMILQANSSSSWGSPPFQDSSISNNGFDEVPPHRNVYHELASAENYRYWRIGVADTSNPDGFYEMGEWWLGERYEFTKGNNYQSQMRETFMRNNAVLVTEWANRFVYSRANHRAHDLEWTHIDQDTVDQFREMEHLKKGGGLPFVWVPNATETAAEALFVRQDGDLSINQVAPLYFNISIRLLEEAAGFSLPEVA